MANFTATVTYTCTINVTIPDSKLKEYLENNSIADYAELTFNPLPKNVSVEIDGVDIAIDDYGSISKNNGNEYEWDGERLTKI